MTGSFAKLHCRVTILYRFIFVVREQVSIVMLQYNSREAGKHGDHLVLA